MLANPGSSLARFYGGFAETCSYCGRPLADPVVHWHCAVDLWLHVECAHDLALRLLFDAERARRIRKGESPVAGIDRAFYAAERPP
jgi:hypothetical protein